MPVLPIHLGRLIGAAGFALFWTVMFAIGQLLDRNVDIAGLAGAFLASGVVGYLGWPGFADVWARRDKRDDPKRILAIAVGIAAGFALTQVVAILAGDDEAGWSVVLWGGSVAVIGVLVVMQVRRARRSK